MALQSLAGRVRLMSLQNLQTTLESELEGVMEVFEELATTRTFSLSSDFTREDDCLLEGVLSQIWQIWNRFCREVFIESCMGTMTLAGPVVGLPLAVSPEAVSQAVIRARKNRIPFWLGSNAILKLEPTWGDVNVLLGAIASLNPSNAVKLQQLCTASATGIRVVQIARNAAAHINPQTMSALAQISSGYTAFPITHPCQCLFWTEPTSQNFLLVHAIEAMKDSAVGCVL